mmetsp:Transcript_58011/g.164844  ORF Transcript_58011/g.164844 Transcript_58011/m.164844 type:complete len:250 (+) Transcript_58011:1480-2229(+)
MASRSQQIPFAILQPTWWLEIPKPDHSTVSGSRSSVWNVRRCWHQGGTPKGYITGCFSAYSSALSRCPSVLKIMYASPEPVMFSSREVTSLRLRSESRRASTAARSSMPRSLSKQRIFGSIDRQPHFHDSISRARRGLRSNVRDLTSPIWSSWWSSCSSSSRRPCSSTFSPMVERSQQIDTPTTSAPTLAKALWKKAARSVSTGSEPGWHGRPEATIIKSCIVVRSRLFRVAHRRCQMAYAMLAQVVNM